MIITYLHIINIIVYHICHRIPYIRVLVGPSQTRTLALFHSNTTFSHPERGIKIVSQFVSLLHSFRFQLLRLFRLFLFFYRGRLCLVVCGFVCFFALPGDCRCLWRSGAWDRTLHHRVRLYTTSPIFI